MTPTEIRAAQKRLELEERIGLLKKKINDAGYNLQLLEIELDQLITDPEGYIREKDRFDFLWHKFERRGREIVRHLS